jgi:hypothetical protein
LKNEPAYQRALNYQQKVSKNSDRSLSVLLLVISELSSAHFYRMFPQTSDFLSSRSLLVTEVASESSLSSDSKKSFASFEFDRYAALSPETITNQLLLLTGQSKIKIPSTYTPQKTQQQTTTPSFLGGREEERPWLFQAAQSAGAVTMFSEEVRLSFLSLFFFCISFLLLHFPLFGSFLCSLQSGSPSLIYLSSLFSLLSL